MSIVRTLQVLRELEAPEALFSTPANVLVDAHGAIHTAEEECTSSDGSSLLLVETSEALGEHAPQRFCDCIVNEYWDEDHPWYHLPLFHAAVSEIDATRDLRDPVQCARIHQALGHTGPVLARRAEHARKTSPDMAPIFSGLYDRVCSIQADVLTTLRSPEVRERFFHKPTPPSKEAYALVISAPLDSFAFTSTILMALLLSYTTEHPSGDVRAVLPASAFKRAYALMKDAFHYGGISSGQSLLLTPEDTPSVVETALSLWDPLPGNKLHDLKAAFELARTV